MWRGGPRSVVPVQGADRRGGGEEDEEENHRQPSVRAPGGGGQSVGVSRGSEQLDVSTGLPVNLHT